MASAQVNASGSRTYRSRDIGRANVANVLETALVALGNGLLSYDTHLEDVLLILP